MLRFVQRGANSLMFRNSGSLVRHMSIAPKQEVCQSATVGDQTAKQYPVFNSDGLWSQYKNRKTILSNPYIVTHQEDFVAFTERLKDRCLSMGTGFGITFGLVISSFVVYFIHEDLEHVRSRLESENNYLMQAHNSIDRIKIDHKKEIEDLKQSFIEFTEKKNSSLFYNNNYNNDKYEKQYKLPTAGTMNKEILSLSQFEKFNQSRKHEPQCIENINNVKTYGYNGGTNCYHLSPEFIKYLEKLGYVVINENNYKGSFRVTLGKN